MENEFDESSFGHIVELIQQYEEAVESKETVFFEQEKFEQIIQFYEENNEANKALRVIESALEHYSFSAYFHTKKAEILANQRRFDEALAALDMAESLDPTDLNILLIRADVYLWQGRHEEAMAQVETGLSVSTFAEDKSELYLQMADIYEDQEKFAEMKEALKMALYEDPESEEGLNRIWFCTELLQKYEESIELHKKLIDLSPYSYLAWFNLGHAYVGVGDFENALEAFGFVIAIDENYDAAYVCSADVLYNLEKYDESLKFYLDAIKLSKPNKELYLKTGETYEKLHDLPKARTFIRKAISLDPYFDEAFFKIGETYRSEENWVKVISSFERALKLSKDNIDYLTALAETYLIIDDAEKAIDMFERVFQLEPENKQSWINLATAYYNIENYRKAFQVLTEAEKKYENNADIFYIKSVFYLQIGNRHEAFLNLERGLLIDFEQHSIIFEMDDSLLDNDSVLQLIEQYRP
jgi:tetratricopeptide (TPR) repeat protein